LLAMLSPKAADWQQMLLVYGNTSTHERVEGFFCPSPGIQSNAQRP
jgi:hypothetical protein